MDDFISVEFLLTFAGTITFVTVATQASKSLLPEKIDTKWLALAFSIIASIFRVILAGDYSASAIILAFVNLFLIYGCSIGLFETGKSVINFFKKEKTEDSEIQTLNENK